MNADPGSADLDDIYNVLKDISKTLDLLLSRIPTIDNAPTRTTRDA